MVKVRLKVKLGSLDNVVIARKAEIKTNVSKNIILNNNKVKVAEEYEAEM